MPAKKKVVPKILKLDIPIYHQELVVASDPDELIKYVEDTYQNSEISHHVEDFVNSCLGGFIHFATGNNHQAFLLFAPNAGVLCHESVHAAWGILDYVCVKVNAKNHEALAYLTGYIFEESQAGLGIK